MKRTILVMSVGLLAGWALLGCDGQADEATITTGEPAPTTTAPPVATTQVALVTTTTHAADPDAACVECHTNQETLMALAVEAEDGESLSSGEG